MTVSPLRGETKASFAVVLGRGCGALADWLEVGDALPLEHATNVVRLTATRAPAISPECPLRSIRLLLILPAFL